MISILLLSVLFFSTQQEKGLNSPDGNFSVSVDTKEVGDSQSGYIMLLTDNRSRESVEISSCITKDLPPPNFYWDKNSRFLIFEQSDNAFDKATIKILNLKTQRIDVELSGLIGSNDHKREHYDSDNEIIFFFKSSPTEQIQIPILYAYELKSKKMSLLLNFDTKFEMDFPTIKRVAGKRELIVNYYNTISGNHTKLVKY